MEDSLRQQMEMAQEGKSEETKAYFREYAAILEKYIALSNANNRNPEVWRGLQAEMVEKVEARYAAYLKECADKGLPSEVGRMSAR